MRPPRRGVAGFAIAVLVLVVGPRRRGCCAEAPENPRFAAPIGNITVAVGREALLACLVEDLGQYKVAWLRVDTQTILTIHNHVITKNHRIGVTHSEHKTFFLHIKEVKKSDKGWYMCQINTDPMKSQVGYLDVVVPPDIVDHLTSRDAVVREGSEEKLACSAHGTPTPYITWRRENGLPIRLPTGEEVASVDGSVLSLTHITRDQMGAYLCIASNGVPPSVSKRIILIVHFPPTVWIQNQLVGAYESQDVVLECISEAYPKAISYWTNANGDILSKSEKYEPSYYFSKDYKLSMKLLIKSIEESDYGNYKCITKNSLGETDGSVQLYAIPKPFKLSDELSRTGDRTGLLQQEAGSGGGARGGLEPQLFLCGFLALWGL